MPPCSAGNNSSVATDVCSCCHYLSQYPVENARAEVPAILGAGYISCHKLTPSACTLFLAHINLTRLCYVTLSPPEGVSISRLPLNNAHPDSSTPRQIGEVPNASQQKDFSHSRNVKRLALTLPTTSCPGTKGYLPWEPPTTKVSEWHTPHAFGAKKREHAKCQICRLCMRGM